MQMFISIPNHVHVARVRTFHAAGFPKLKLKTETEPKLNRSLRWWMAELCTSHIFLHYLDTPRKKEGRILPAIHGIPHTGQLHSER